MTFQLVRSRRRDYVLFTSDESVYAKRPGEDDDCSRPIELRVSRKAQALTDKVLLGLGGSIALTEDFRRLIEERVAPDDDLTAAYTAAREVIAEMTADDRPDDLYVGEHFGAVYDAYDKLNDPRTTMVLRGSVARDLTLIMAGFRRDGTTTVVQYSQRGFEDFDDAEEGEFTCSIPFGLEVDDVAGFFVVFEPLGPIAALQHALSCHRELNAKHPERVTRETSGVILRWAGAETRPRMLDFTSVDVCDLGLCAQLASATLLMDEPKKRPADPAMLRA